jgi:hypothetical protein
MNIALQTGFGRRVRVVYDRSQRKGITGFGRGDSD